MSLKRTYVVIEPGDGSPRIGDKYDLFVVPWTSVATTVQEYLDEVDLYETASLAFTIHNWTDEEYQAFCEKHEIEERR